jgi:hypothetical protein
METLPELNRPELDRAELAYSDLQGTLLAMVHRTGSSYRIIIDRDAAGAGWFVDSSPHDHDEFTWASSRQGIAAAGSPAAGRVDLLTVLAHELGHVVGIPDLASQTHGISLMADSLPAGVRRLPAVDDPLWKLLPPEGLPVDVGQGPIEHSLHLAAPQEVVNGTFQISDPADPLFGWSKLGGATVAGGLGVLAEDGLFTSRFLQTIEIPDEAMALEFTIQPSLLANTLAAPDAFEVALLDEHTGMSVVGRAQGLSGTDAILNIQFDGTTYFGSQVTVPGAAASGDIISYDQPKTVVVDLSGLTENVTATLYFDLLGFGELSSQVTIDNVRLLVEGTPSVNIQLDPASDSGQPGDNITKETVITVQGQTEPDEQVQVDVDGDGVHDVTVTADNSGAFSVPNVSLQEGQNTITAALASERSSVAQLLITRETQSPSGTLQTPAPSIVTNLDLGYVDILWSDSGPVGIDTASFGVDDVSVSGVTVDSFAPQSGGVVRYFYSGQLAEGPVAVTLHDGAVVDLAGNASVESTESFSFDATGPNGNLVDPAAGSVTGADKGYVDVQWSDAGPAGLQESSFGIEDITVSGVTVSGLQDLGSGLVRYFYSGSLAEGEIEVTQVAGQILDQAGNSNAGAVQSFTFQPVTAEPQDVTDLVQVRYFGTQVNSRLRTVSFFATITNTSQHTLLEPLSLVWSNLLPTTAVARNTDGTLPDGSPYYDFSGLMGDGILEPGEVTQSRWLTIYNPTFAPLSYDSIVTAVVAAGPAPGGAPPVAHQQLTAEDLTNLIVNFGSSSATRHQGDFTGDGRVQEDDLAILVGLRPPSTSVRSANTADTLHAPFNSAAVVSDLAFGPQRPVAQQVAGALACSAASVGQARALRLTATDVALSQLASELLSPRDPQPDPAESHDSTQAELLDDLARHLAAARPKPAKP